MLLQEFFSPGTLAYQASVNVGQEQLHRLAVDLLRVDIVLNIVDEMSINHFGDMPLIVHYQIDVYE